LVVTFADRTPIRRNRRLTGGSSAHTDDLRRTAYEMYDAP
jgi:DNA polymerase-4